MGVVGWVWGGVGFGGFESLGLGVGRCDFDVGCWVLGVGRWAFGVRGLGSWVLGLVSGIWGLEFGVWGLGFGVWGLGLSFGVWVWRRRVCGMRCGVYLPEPRLSVSWRTALHEKLWNKNRSHTKTERQSRQRLATCWCHCFSLEG